MTQSLAGLEKLGEGHIMHFGVLQLRSTLFGASKNGVYPLFGRITIQIATLRKEGGKESEDMIYRSSSGFLPLYI